MKNKLGNNFGKKHMGNHIGKNIMAVFKVTYFYMIRDGILKIPGSGLEKIK